MVIMAAAYYGVWHFSFGVFQHAEGVDARFLNRVWNPIYAFDVLGIGPPGTGTARAVYAVLVTSIAMGFVGCFTRLSTGVAALLSFYWIGTAYSFGKPHHDCISLMFALAILPFTPAGERLSLDSLVARIRASRGGGSPERPEKAPYAALALRLTMITGALGYFFSGASKLVIAGVGWMNGYTLQGIMLEYRSDWSEPLSDDLFLLQLMSVGLIFVQVSFPIALFWKASRWFYVPMGVGFHLMAMKTMATGPFLTLWFTLAAFLPLERIPDVLDAGLSRGRSLVRVLFAATFAAVSWGILSMYLQHKSPWLLLIVLPFFLSVLLRSSGPRRMVVVAGPEARGWVGLLRGLDWAGRIEVWEGVVPQDAAGVSFARLAGRLPLLLPLYPLVALVEATGILGRTPRFFRASPAG